MSDVDQIDPRFTTEQAREYAVRQISDYASKENLTGNQLRRIFNIGLSAATVADGVVTNLSEKVVE